jgi:manganese efflux pump family protein
LVLQLIVLGIVVAANNLATALALGSLGQVERRWRVALVFGFFEFVVPLIGIWVGRQVADWIDNLAGWIAPLLLALMGLWAIRAALRDSDEDKELAEKVTTWRGLLLLAFGLSLDNLVVGFSLGLRGQDPLLVAAVIAVCSMVFSWAGMWFGSRSEHRYETEAQLGAGLLLIGLALATWLNWI